MYLSKAASFISFFGSLVIGAAAAWVVSPLGSYAADSSAGPMLTAPITQGSTSVGGSCHRAVKVVSVRAEDMRGRWTGYWGIDDDSSVMNIDRVEGNKFYGTLSDGEAEIRIEGMIDTDARRVTIRETKVLKLGPGVEWSLGKDIGSFSADGRTLSGSGNDQWQSYEWEMQKD